MNQVASKYVIDKLEAGVNVICVDFKKNRIMSCMEMTMGVLLTVLADPMCLFFAEAGTQ